MTDVPSSIARLRRTVKEQPGEDLRSVVVRYAHIKRISVERLLRLGLGVDANSLASVPLRRTQLETFADLAGLELRKLANDAFAEGRNGFELFGQDAGSDVIEPYRRRVAPGMLKLDDIPWIRAHWQVTCLPCDPDSGECFIQICPTCRKSLSWVGIESVYRCQNCATDLRSAAPRYASERKKELAKLMVGVLRRESKALAQLPAIIANSTVREQLAFFSVLACLSFIVAGRVLPHGTFATFRGLELALEYPSCLDKIVADIVRSHDEVSFKLGWFAAIMEVRYRLNFLPAGKIRQSVRRRVSRLMGVNDEKYMIVRRTVPDFSSDPCRSISFRYQSFLRGVSANHRP
jgi:hypothetical protein